MQLEEIDVHYCVNYLTETDGVKWRNEDYQAMNMVKALKGDSFRGYFDINVGGVSRRFDSESAAKFADICHLPLVKIIKEKLNKPLSIVPIPSSKTTVVSCDNFRTLPIAMRMAKALGDGYTCEPILVFNQEMESSRQSKRRNPVHIESNYKILANPTNPILLFDDVYTTGAHIKAACWKLKSSGYNVVGGITFARTTKDGNQPQFVSQSEKLDIQKVQEVWDF